ncbi:MAG: ROK family protein [Terrimicrobiaceae bacterium]|nr:ROK family protein [Terrimicrobiaceae bacterium]
MSGLLWGIDLGGTKIEGAIVDPEFPDRAIHRLREETGADHGYEHVFGQILRVIQRLEEAAESPAPEVIGIGTPGAIDPASGTLKNSNSTCLNGRTLRADLEEQTGRRFHMANDANCCALAEATLGAAAGEHVVFGIILGTGVGGGVVVGGQVLEGLHGIAGEWGHNPMRGESHPCYCGRAGCVETVFAGPSLERFYLERGGEAIRLPEIARRAAHGEPLATETLHRLRDKFGEALAAILNVLDPDAVVIGGGVGNLDILYAEETRAAIRRHLFNPELRTRILRPALGDSAGVFGAAMLSRQPTRS